MQFLYQGLAWGFLLAFVPVLIHLINMMRHRRVKWAAMEFLLQSYKKHRKWVWLKQLLLLLARMAAIAILVAMLAQWITRGEWLDFLGGKITHHYVLIDDSGSMGEQYGAMSAFEEAGRFMQRLATSAADQPVPQRFTVLRFSQALGSGEDTDGLADMHAEQVDSEFPERMEQLRHSFELTEAAIGPGPVLSVLEKLLEESPDEDRIVYLVSDFRRWQWKQTARIKSTLRNLEDAGVQVRLVQCVGRQRPNLALIDVAPSTETRAAEVPLFIDIKIRNTGVTAADNVPVKIRSIFYDAQSTAGPEPRPHIEDLPLMLVDRIGPGETVTRRVQVYFPAAGQHVVEVELPEDALSTDNRRWCVIDFPQAEPVLVIDGDPNQQNAQFLAAIFQPGVHARTGIQAEVKPAEFLRDATAEELGKYYTIFVCDLPRIDQVAVEHLETYVREGGGVVFFAGPNWAIAAHNAGLYRNGEGVFPLLLERDDLLPIDELTPAPDVQMVEDRHPVFRELTQGANPLIHSIHVERYLRTAGTWQSAPNREKVRVIAKLRNGQPLVVEQSFGKGRVIAVLSTFAPYWNDLALNATVVIALRLQAYLGAAKRPIDRRVVGEGLQVSGAASDFDSQFQWFLPMGESDDYLPLTRAATTPGSPSRLVGELAVSEVLHPGIYEVWMKRRSGEIVAKRFAVNVDPAESQLATVTDQEMNRAMQPLEVKFARADAFAGASITTAGFNRSLFLMLLLVSLLLGEQWLAYSASYHPVKGGAR